MSFFSGVFTVFHILIHFRAHGGSFTLRLFWTASAVRGGKSCSILELLTHCLLQKPVWYLSPTIYQSIDTTFDHECWSKNVRKGVLEMFGSTTSQASNISQSFVQSIIRTWRGWITSRSTNMWTSTWTDREGDSGSFWKNSKHSDLRKTVAAGQLAVHSRNLGFMGWRARGNIKGFQKFKA